VAARLGTREVVHGASCSLRSGEVLGIIGPNGAGKSSLLRIMAGLLAPHRGEVRLEGRALGEWPARERARTIAWLPQSAPVHWPLTVRTVVELGRLPYRSGWFGTDPDGTEAVAQALRQAEVEALEERLVTELSGGERTRVMVARLLAAAPRVVLADEPVAALDAYHQLHVMELLVRRARAGAAVAVVLHDLGLAARFCDRILLLDGGRVVTVGEAARVLCAELLEPVYGVRMRVLEIDGLLTVIPWERAAAAL